jgi:hypothetical protein
MCSLAVRCDALRRDTPRTGDSLRRWRCRRNGKSDRRQKGNKKRCVGDDSHVPVTANVEAAGAARLLRSPA